MPFILDCSVALTWVMPDEDNDHADTLLDRLLSDSAVVPELWPLEVSNVLLVAQRRKRIEEDEITRAIGALRTLPIEVDFKTHEYAFGDTLEYALKFGLTIYDAAYLELSLRRNLPLATLDKGLIKACTAAGIETL